MAVKLRHLKNQTSVAQAFVYEGHQIILGPGEEKVFLNDLAKAFLEASAPFVKEVEIDKVGSVYSEKDDQKTVWVANMTGDPDASAETSTKAFINKKWTDSIRPNPKLKDITIKREMGGGQLGFDLPDNEYGSINLPPVEITLPPYQRRELPTAIAMWFLNRDATQEPGMVGSAILSRPRSNFEPDSSWDLDDMRAYLRLCDPIAVLGDSEDTVVVKAKQANDNAEIAVHLAKLACLKRLHFRMANPVYRLPTKREFEDFRKNFNDVVAPKQLVTTAKQVSK